MSNPEQIEDFILDLILNHSAVMISDVVIDLVRDLSKDNDVLQNRKADLYKLVIARLTNEANNIETEGKINVE